MVATIFGPFSSADLAALRERWGLLLACGIAILVLGLVALSNIMIATVASIYYVGATILIAGILQISYAFLARGWRPFLSWFLIGVLYALAGVLAFLNPLLASSVLTLLFAVSLLAVGLLRMLAGLALRPSGFAGWLVGGGALSLIAGLLVLAGWPANSVWLLGLLLAVDLIFHGGALAAFAVWLKRQR